MKSGKPLVWSGCSWVKISAVRFTGSSPAASRRWTTSPPQSITISEASSATASMVVVRCGSLTAAPVPSR